MSAKLAVAGEHIETAIFLIGANAHPRSIHLLVMAADEIITNLLSHTGTKPKVDVSSVLTEEGKQMWASKKGEVYNYLKHARRDYRDGYSGPDDASLAELNDIFLILAATGYAALAGQPRPLLPIFVNLAGMRYEGLVDWEAEKVTRPEIQVALDIMYPMTRESFVSYVNAAAARFPLTAR